MQTTNAISDGTTPRECASFLSGEARDKIEDSQLRGAVASSSREGERRRGHYGRSGVEGFGWLMDSPVPPRSNFRAVTLRIKGWVVSGQLGRRRDPRVRLEQPPFVRGITSAKERKRYFNARRPSCRQRRGRWRIREITNRGVSADIAKDEQ